MSHRKGKHRKKRRKHYGIHNDGTAANEGFRKLRRGHSVRRQGLCTDCHWKGGFTAEIYEFVETPDETGLGDIECRLAPWGKTDERFADNGHAIAWCMAQVK